MKPNKKHTLKKPYPFLTAQNDDTFPSDENMKRAKYTESPVPETTSSNQASNLLLLSAVCCFQSAVETSLSTTITPLEKETRPLIPNQQHHSENIESNLSSTIANSSSYQSIVELSSLLKPQDTDMFNNAECTGNIPSNSSNIGTCTETATSINTGTIITNNSNTSTEKTCSNSTDMGTNTTTSSTGAGTSTEANTTSTSLSDSTSTSTTKIPMRIVFEHNAYSFLLKKQQYFVPYDLPEEGIEGNFEGRLHNGDHILSINDISVKGWTKARMTAYLKNHTVDTMNFHRGRSYRKEYFKLVSTEKVKSGKNILACKLYRARKKLAAIKNELASLT